MRASRRAIQLWAALKGCPARRVTRALRHEVIDFLEDVLYLAFDTIGHYASTPSAA
jgi:hypothetical protein